MASLPVKLKLLPRTTVKAKTLSQMPVRILGGDAILVDRNAGTWTISVDPDTLPAVVGLVIGTDVQAQDADLQALADNSTNGFWARTGAGTGAARTITGTATEITVTFGDGVSGNPTISIPAAVTFTGKTITGGTFSSPTMITPVLGAATGTSLALGGALISGVILSTQGTGLASIHVSKQTDGASSTTGASGFEATSDVADVALIANGTARTTTRYGFTIGGYSELTVFGGTNGLILGTNTAAPVILGTNNLPRLTLSVAGAARFHAYGTGTLITDASGNVTANTETGTGNSVRGSTPTIATPVITGGTANRLIVTDGSGNWGMGTVPTGLALSGSALSFDIPSLTNKASPNSTNDYVIIYDAAGTATKKATVGSVGAAGAVSSLNGQTGALALVHPPQGRLTLQTVTPVMTTTQSAKTTIYYTPYVGNQIVLYDGTNMVPTTFAEISVLTTDTTKNPAAIGASKVNDWFIWTDAGTLRLTHGPDWTNDTTRSAGTALVLTGGILLNNASITNGPAASRGTYVGTTRSNGSSQLDWIFGAAANGGTAGFFGLWNAYNRIVVGSMTQDTTDNWSYNSNTIRQMNASAGNQHTIVRGLDEDAVTANLIVGSISGVSTTFGAIGIGLDSTTAFTGMRGLCGTFAGQVSASAQYSGLPGIGVHVISANERTLSGSATFVGDDGLTTLDQTGLAYTGKH
jgi:hypothetical protein